jgi:hypothetical protein
VNDLLILEVIDWMVIEDGNGNGEVFVKFIATKSNECGDGRGDGDGFGDGNGFGDGLFRYTHDIDVRDGQGFW